MAINRPGLLKPQALAISCPACEIIIREWLVSIEDCVSVRYTEAFKCVVDSLYAGGAKKVR